MRQYIFFEYSAIQEIISNRFFQSIEYKEAQMLVRLLKEVDIDNEWHHNKICANTSDKGIIFLTKDSDKKRGILFDLTLFHCFETEEETKIIAIISKVLRYSIRYFDNLPIISNEKLLTDKQTTIVYPFSFVAHKDSYKILIDRNTSKQKRKERNILTVFYYGTKGEQEEVSFTVLNKMIADLKDTTYKIEPSHNDIQNISLQVTDLSELELSIDSCIGFNNWKYYLTSTQQDFINKELSGAERLEGAAGTGKTLTLVLRAITLLNKARNQNKELHLIFFTHSLSTKDRIKSIFSNNWTEFECFEEKNNGRAMQSVLITTLQEWSIRHLGINSLSENEYLDKDAENSKIYQTMYIEQALDEAKSMSWSNLYKKLCSDNLISFIEDTPIEYQIEVLQREFSEIIKGQSESQIEKYLTIERPTYSLKLDRDEDRRFIFNIFQSYQKTLYKLGQFDSDDIVITALGQVNSPIWNRRRMNEGYDACIIDETHLFNMNEISLFHYVNKPNKKNTIIYAIDRSQAVGDTYHADEDLINPDAKRDEKISSYSTIFRSSPEISALAFSVLSSGASMFNNFQNPLETSIFTFTANEERKLRKPVFISCIDDEKMFDKAYRIASSYIDETGSLKSNILFVPVTDILLKSFAKYSEKFNKPFEILESRADFKSIREAKNRNRYVVGGIDYIGGLEFEVVILIGIDKGRIPPKATPGSIHILNYAWYNRLYVAITRAKYAVYIIGDSTGISPLLEEALINKNIEFQQD